MMKRKERIRRKGKFPLFSALFELPHPPNFILLSNLHEREHKKDDGRQRIERNRKKGQIKDVLSEFIHIGVCF
jgi:hypothetical protein